MFCQGRVRAAKCSCDVSTRRRGDYGRHSQLAVDHFAPFCLGPRRSTILLRRTISQCFALKWRFSLGLAVGVATFVAYVFTIKFPAFSAVACPGCYGLEQLEPDLLVDREMGKSTRQHLLTEVQISQARIKTFYGQIHETPTLVVCSTDVCSQRLGGRGAYAVTYSSPTGTIVRVAPKGMNRIIITHELSHVELHKRVGSLKVLFGAFPAWFDEGVAAYVSEDGRYLNPGPDADARCQADTPAPLPMSSISWVSATRQGMQVYQYAACRTMKWMDANGGQAGLLAMLDRVGKGQKGP